VTAGLFISAPLLTVPQGHSAVLALAASRQVATQFAGTRVLACYARNCRTGVPFEWLDADLAPAALMIWITRFE
jgi:hypothetical protein